MSFELLRVTPGVHLEEHLRPSVRSGEYVHNAFLGSLAELGPLGLALFVGILGSTAARLRRAAREARAAGPPLVRAVANALVLGLVGLVLASLLLSTETSRILWVLVGLGLSLPGLVPLQRPPGPAET